MPVADRGCAARCRARASTIRHHQAVTASPVVLGCGTKEIDTRTAAQVVEAAALGILRSGGSWLPKTRAAAPVARRRIRPLAIAYRSGPASGLYGLHVRATAACADQRVVNSPWILATELRARTHASRQSARTATSAPNCWAASVMANRISRSAPDRATGSSVLPRSCSTACARASSDRSRQASIGPSAVSAPGSPAAASSAWALASRTAACSKTAVPGWRAVSVESCVVEVIGRSWLARAATTMRSRL